MTATSYFTRVDEMQANGTSSFIARVANESEVVSTVSRNQGAIGYVGAGRYIVNNGNIYYVQITD